MKKNLFMLVLVFHSMLTSAFEGYAEVDGINYYIITKGATAEVSFKLSGYKGDVVIPATIEYDGVTCTVNSIGNSAFYVESELTSVVIPSTVTKIGLGAFQECTKLKSVNIPKSVVSIGTQAFFKCENLETVKIDNIESWCKMEIGKDANPLPYAKHFVVDGEEVENLVIPSTVTSICDRAFHGYKGLKTVSMNENVTSIGDYAFFQCTGLTSVTLPNSIRTIGVGAFYGCSSLANLSLPEGLKIVNEYCFQNCGSLLTLTIPDDIEEIGRYSFSNCTNVKSIYIGSGLKVVGNNAFEKCSELIDVYCWAVNPPTIKGFYTNNMLPFSNSHVEYVTLHVPEISIEAYQKSAVWKGFGNIVALTSENTGISSTIIDEKDVAGFYSLGGLPVNSRYHRLSVIKMSNGTTKKVLKTR